MMLLPSSGQINFDHCENRVNPISQNLPYFLGISQRSQTISLEPCRTVIIDRTFTQGFHSAIIRRNFLKKKSAKKAEKLG